MACYKEPPRSELRQMKSLEKRDRERKKEKERERAKKEEDTGLKVILRHSVRGLLSQHFCNPNTWSIHERQSQTKFTHLDISSETKPTKSTHILFTDINLLQAFNSKKYLSSTVLFWCVLCKIKNEIKLNLQLKNSTLCYTTSLPLSFFGSVLF